MKTQILTNIITWLIILVLLTCVLSVDGTEPEYSNTSDFQIYANDCIRTRSGKDILYVGGTGQGNYTLIQEAIFNVSSGGTVYVFSGIYNEHVEINKSINLIGEDKNTTIIQAKKHLNLVEILNESVSLQGFTIKQLRPSHYDPIGILLRDVENCFISNINISCSGGIGISLTGSNNSVTNNSMSIIDCLGIMVSGSNNEIKFNKIIGSGEGIKLNYASKNIISKNNLSNNGIGLIDSSSNILRENNIDNILINNPTTGIYLSDSSENKIYYNFINSTTTGIEIGDSYNNEIKFNNIQYTTNNGLSVESSSQVIIGNNFKNCGVRLISYEHQDFSENNINGKPILMLKKQNDMNLNNEPVGQIFIVRCKNISLRNLSIDHSYNGISVILSENTIIENCIISNNSYCGIEIKNSINNSLFNNVIIDNYIGLEFDNTQNNIVQGNTISNNSHFGIELYGSKNNTIKNNIVSFNKLDGIRFWQSSSNGIIKQNEIKSNGESGIEIQGISDIIILDNYVRDNEHGIRVRSSFWISIIFNEIVQNEYGISFGNCGNNIVYYNKIIDNSIQMFLNEPSKTNFSSNHWDNGAGEGNYWSDYNGNDKDNNGIGDTPYEISYGYKDNYPLVVQKIEFYINDYDNDNVNNNLDPNPYSRIDQDEDGISDDFEIVLSHTNISNPDTDGDDYPDGHEVDSGTDPLDDNDYPKDEFKTSSPFQDYAILIFISVTIIILILMIISSIKRSKKRNNRNNEDDEELGVEEKAK
jgi:parallel beta-helix repeat protein